MKILKKPENRILLFLVPGLFMFITFIIIPVINSVNLSLTNWDGISSTYSYVGLRNFKFIFQDPRFYNALKNTIIIGAFFTLFANLTALLIAILLDNVIKGKNFFRSIFYLPVLMSGVIVGFIWSIMLNYSFGIINNALGQLGLDTLQTNFTGEMPNAMISLIFVLVWQRLGYYMIIYLAGLQGIPKELIEASKINGASRFQVFKHVTFPLLAGSMTVNMTLALIFGMKVFGQLVVLTGGGPGFATENLVYVIYKVAFAELKQGYGTALSLVLFVLVGAFSLIQVFILRKREVQL